MLEIFYWILRSIQRTLFLLSYIFLFPGNKLLRKCRKYKKTLCWNSLQFGHGICFYFWFHQPQRRTYQAKTFLLLCCFDYGGWTSDDTLVHESPWKSKCLHLLLKKLRKPIKNHFCIIWTSSKVVLIWKLGAGGSKIKPVMPILVSKYK